MVGRRNSQQQLDRLIGEVSRGERELSSIGDADLREAVRLALRLHQKAPAPLDSYAKARLRARVLAGLRPRGPTLLDNAWTGTRWCPCVGAIHAVPIGGESTGRHEQMAVRMAPKVACPPVQHRRTAEPPAQRAAIAGEREEGRRRALHQLQPVVGAISQ